MSYGAPVLVVVWRNFFWILPACVGCSSAREESAPVPDAAPDVATDVAMDSAAEALSAADAGDASCFLSKVGVFGQCMTTQDCAALGKYISTPGYCTAANVECCTRTPNVADNPPIPAGWKLMSQSSVTPAMTTWAVSILHDPIAYPMFLNTFKMFGALNVMARVEWHPPDFQNSTIHRGVTLYQPI